MIFRTVHFYDADSEPLEGLDVSTMLDRYVDREGNVVTPEPLPVEIGGGGYGVVIPDGDVALGVVLSFDGGPTAVETRYQAFAVSRDGLIAVLMLNDDGTRHESGSPPGFGLYADPDGNSQPAPEFVSIENWLWTASPTAEDLALGIGYRVDLPVDEGALPPFYTGNVDDPVGGDVDPPEVTVSPASGSELTPTQPVVVTVIDDQGLRRTLLIARFDNGTDELIFDGTRFATRYRDSSSSPITGGVVVTVRRSGGWTSAPTIDVFAIDTSGNEAA